MRFDLTVNEFTRDALLSGELVVYGEQFWRPYVHVRDAARAIATVLDAAPEAVSGEVFNVGDTGQNFRKQDLVDLLVERLPDTRVEFVARTEDPRDYRVSFEKIQRRSVTTSRGRSRRESTRCWVAPAGVIGDPFDPMYATSPWRRRAARQSTIREG